MNGNPQSRYISADQAARLVRPGDRIFVGTACATPRRLVAAVEALAPAPADVEFFHFLTTDAIPYVDGEPVTKYRHRCFFVGTDVRELVKRGLAEYVPVSLSEVPRLIETGRFHTDIAFIQVTPPDSHGYVSLGVSVDITAAIARHARMIVAEVNPNMPRTMGDTFIHVDRIAHFVAVDDPILEYSHVAPDEVAERVARYIAGIIDDGSTLQIGLGNVPNAALKYLLDRRDLGVHSDVITDGILDLVEKGIINGARKQIYPGQIVASYCLGTRRLYDFIDGNPMFLFKPIEFVSNPATIAAHPKMVSVTQAFAVDLTGQICADQFEGEFYSGVSTQPDFLRGAARSPGGKPIICLASTTDDGKTSRIRPLLEMGEGVAIARSDAHYVVTEYGIAYLFGKSIRERTLALIEIAHPLFRPWLLDEAKRLGYVPPGQRIDSQVGYQIEEERRVTLKDGRTVLIRPARASDAAAIQHLVHEMSGDDVSTRFFRRLRALSYSEAETMCSVNYETEVAFVATTGAREHERIVAISCYHLDASVNLAETAYAVIRNWQGTGLGQALQLRMMEYARDRGVRGFTAAIQVSNLPMVNLARKCCNNVTIERRDDAYHLTMCFDG